MPGIQHLFEEAKLKNDIDGIVVAKGQVPILELNWRNHR